MRKPWQSLKKTAVLIEQQYLKNCNHYKHFDIFCQDESRFGLFTRNGKALTAKGIKPVCPYDHKFENTYLFGAFSPITGYSFMLELPFCNTEMFQLYLNEFHKHKPNEYKIIFLDNGAFHKAKRLIIPPSIGLIFLPPYSPELNPAEKVWWVLKREVNMKVYKTLPQLQDHLQMIIQKIITPKTIKSLTGYPVFLSAYQTVFN